MDKYLQIIASASLFRGIAKTEIAAVLQNLDAQLRVYPRNSFIWQLGEQVTTAGFVVAGSVHILREDYWGRQNILAQLGCGHLFGEVYACLRQVPLTVSVAAPNGATVIFLDIKSLLAGSARSEAENRLLHNLLLLMAERNLFLTQKMEYLTKRTTREKLLAYLSEQARLQQSNKLTIPFNRQQLADFLAVDRSAMSGELSKMQADGLIRYKKNNFELLQK